MVAGSARNRRTQIPPKVPADVLVRWRDSILGGPKAVDPYKWQGMRLHDDVVREALTSILPEFPNLGLPNVKFGHSLLREMEIYRQLGAYLPSYIASVRNLEGEMATAATAFAPHRFQHPSVKRIAATISSQLRQHRETLIQSQLQLKDFSRLAYKWNVWGVSEQGEGSWTMSWKDSEYESLFEGLRLKDVLKRKNQVDVAFQCRVGALLRTQISGKFFMKRRTIATLVFLAYLCADFLDHDDVTLVTRVPIDTTKIEGNLRKAGLK
jgi:hypothetical protein